MKISTFLIILSISVSSAFAQSYKIKKGTLYKGKEAVAKIDGAMSLTKADLTATTLDGTTVLKVKGHVFDDIQPGMEPIYWYTFTFPQFDRKFTIKQKSNYFGTKQFLKNEFAGRNLHFYGDGFKEEDLGVLEDYGEQLSKDTLELLEEINFYSKTLASAKVERDLNAPVAFRNYTNIKGLVITQGYRENAEGEEIPIIIGRINYYKNEGQSISDPSRSHRITLYKKMPSKVEIDGRPTDFVVAGFIDLLENIPELYLYQENKTVSHTQFRSESRNIEDAKRAAKYMVKLGLL